MKLLGKGEMLDNYRIIDILGHGGMGTVYRAEDTQLGIEVAVKVMLPALSGDEDKEFINRFLNEARSQARLRHPNIVRVFALRKFDAGFYIVMDLVEGETLKKRIRSRGALPLQEALPLFYQLLDGIAHAHEHHIIHRDIKPGNLLLTVANEIRIADFGLARMREHTSNTGTGLFRGTIAFCPPEQMRGLKNTDHRSDIYSIGMTLFNAVTGDLPFDDGDPQLPYRLMQGKIPRLARMPLSLPRSLVEVLQKCIEASPDDRYQSVVELKAALQAVDSADTVIDPAPASETATQLESPPSAQHPAANRSRLMLASGGAAALLLVLFFVFQWSSTTGGREGSVIEPAIDARNQAVIAELAAITSFDELGAYLNQQELNGILAYGDSADFHTPEHKLVVLTDGVDITAMFQYTETAFIDLQSGNRYSHLKEFKPLHSFWIQVLE